MEDRTGVKGPNNVQAKTARVKTATGSIAGADRGSCTGSSPCQLSRFQEAKTEPEQRNSTTTSRRWTHSHGTMNRSVPALKDGRLGRFRSHAPSRTQPSIMASQSASRRAETPVAALSLAGSMAPSTGRQAGSLNRDGRAVNLGERTETGGLALRFCRLTPGGVPRRRKLRSGWNKGVAAGTASLCDAGGANEPAMLRWRKTLRSPTRT